MSGARKVAIVTGAARGIGESVAKKLSAQGYKLYLCSKSPEGAARVARELPDAEGTSVDVGDLDQVRAWAERIASESSEVHAIVNNASPTMAGSLFDTPDADWDEMLRVRIAGPLLLLNTLVDQMPPGSASVFMAGVLMKKPRDAVALLSVVSVGVVALVRALAGPLMKKGIRVNALCLANVTTESHSVFAEAAGMSLEELRVISAKKMPLGILDRDEVAEHVLRLLSPDWGKITGGALNVDGGSIDCV